MRLYHPPDTVFKIQKWIHNTGQYRAPLWDGDTHVMGLRSLEIFSLTSLFRNLEGLSYIPWSYGAGILDVRIWRRNVWIWRRKWIPAEILKPTLGQSLLFAGLVSNRVSEADRQVLRRGGGGGGVSLGGRTTGGIRLPGSWGGGGEGVLRGVWENKVLCSHSFRVLTTGASTGGILEGEASTGGILAERGVNKDIKRN